LAEQALDGDFSLWSERLNSIDSDDVEKALSSPAGVYSLPRLMAPVSPAAEGYLEQMAQQAHQLTIQRFGPTIRLYAPLYLSNYCTNSCRYCGFNKDNKFERTRLTIEQAVEDADVIASEGFRDLLLVSGEDREFITVEYLSELASRLKDKFSYISVEIYGMSQGQYAELFAAGIEGVTIYQETYDRRAYSYYHPAGGKSDYDERLVAQDKIASAGMREIGLGVLLGLGDWRVEALAMALHAHYLIKRYWKSHVSFSFPRLRPAHEVNGSQFEYLLSDRNLVQMMMAIRLCFADAGLVLSTRESAYLRDHLIKLGVTRLSAGSKTNPGGYATCSGAAEQFQVDDDRSPAKVAEEIKKQGFEPVWKDWDSIFTAD